MYIMLTKYKELNLAVVILCVETVSLSSLVISAKIGHKKQMVSKGVENC
jgi:hypothetical protein